MNKIISILLFIFIVSAVAAESNDKNYNNTTKPKMLPLLTTVAIYNLQSKESYNDCVNLCDTYQPRNNFRNQERQYQYQYQQRVETQHRWDYQNNHRNRKPMPFTYYNSNRNAFVCSFDTFGQINCIYRP